MCAEKHLKRIFGAAFFLVKGSKEAEQKSVSAQMATLMEICDIGHALALLLLDTI